MRLATAILAVTVALGAAAPLAAASDESTTEAAQRLAAMLAALEQGGPSAAMQHFARGRHLLEQHDYEAAAEQFLLATSYAPRVGRIWRLLGECRREMDRDEEALDALEKALALAPSDHAARFLAGRTLMGLGRSGRARRMLEGLVDRVPRGTAYDILGHAMLVRLYEHQGLPAPAAKSLERLLAELDEPRPFFRSYPEIYSLYRQRTYFRVDLARLYLKTDQAAKAVEAIEAVADRRPDSLQVLDLLVDAHLALDRHADARKAAETMIDVHPEHGRGYERLVQVYRAEKRLDEAVAALEAYRRKQPENRVIALRLAEAYEAAGKADKAKALYTELAETSTDPDELAEQALRQAEAQVEAGRHLEALKVLARVITGGRPDPSVLIRTARIVDDLPSPEKAYPEVKAMAAPDRKKAGPFIVAGMVAERLRKTDDAIRFYSLAVEREPKLVIGYSRKADLLLQAEKPEDALAVYRRAVEAGIDVPAYHRKIGMILQHLGRHEKALEEFELVRRRAPRDKVARFMLVAAMLRMNRIDDAVTELQALIRDFPADIRARCQLAGIYLVQDKVDEAESLVQKVLSDRPDTIAGKALLAEVRFRQGRYGDAERLCREVLKAEPEHYDTRLLLAHSLSARGHDTEAISQVKALLTAQPENLRWRYLLSGLYQKTGNDEAAERELLTILDAEPADGPANNDLGYLWAERGVNLERAEKMVRRAVAAEPENPAYLDSLGWVLYKRGRFAKSVEALRKAVEISPELDPVLYDHLGDAYWRVGKEAEAAKAWKKARRMIDKGTSEPSEDDLAERVRRKVKNLGAGKQPRVAPLGDDTEPAGGTPAGNEAHKP